MSNLKYLPESILALKDKQVQLHLHEWFGLTSCFVSQVEHYKNVLWNPAEHY